MQYRIFVRAQANPKILDGNLTVTTNALIGSKCLVKDLKPGMDFHLQGALYTVERIEQIK